MSDIQDLRGNIELKKIEAPSLSQSNYGKNIREKFDNIDDNLRRLANRDFVAGKAGKDIKFTKYTLWNDDDFTDLGRVFVQAIVGDEPIDWNHDWNASVLDFTEEFYDRHKILSSVSVQDGSKVKFFEYFIENPNITIMYQLNDHEAPDEEANRLLICSPYVYTFIDRRYAVLGSYTPSNPNIYSGLEDISCLLNLTYDGENPQLERINQFPTLYYDGNGQFRWKLYGSESGILATGPKGTDAAVAPITFARLSSSSTRDNTATELSTSTISQILVIEKSTAKWIDIDKVDEDKLPRVGDSIMAYRPMTLQGAQDSALIGNPTTGQPYTVYFTKVISVVGKVISVCDASSTSIQFLVNATMLDSMLKTIREGSMGTSCLYVPSIGSLDDFDDNSIVHAAIGEQVVESGVTHYYLTLKPIKYGYVQYNPNSASAADNSKLIIDYNDVDVKGNVEVKGNTKLLHNLDVSGSVGISGSLTTSSLTSITAKINNTLKVGTTSRGVEIGRSGTNKDVITLYNNANSKTTTLTSESVATGSVTADKINANVEVNTKLLATDSDELKITSNKSILIDKPLTVSESTTINKDATIKGNATINNILISNKAIINSAKLSLEWKYINESICDRLSNRTTYGPRGDDDVIADIWILKEAEKVYQVLYFDETLKDINNQDINDHNTIAFPSTYPAYSTVIVLHHYKSRNFSNFIKTVSNDKKILRIYNDDMAGESGAMFFVVLGEKTYTLTDGNIDRECREIYSVYKFGDNEYR